MTVAVPVSRLDVDREVEVTALWRADYGKLVGWCAARTEDPDAARDIASEAFARLLTHWYEVRSPRAFLYAAAANLTRDLWRLRSRERRLVGRLSRAQPDGPEERDEAVRDSVARLPRRLREPVELYYYADMPVSAVAAVLRKPPGSIKRALFEGRRLLRKAEVGA